MNTTLLYIILVLLIIDLIVNVTTLLMPPTRGPAGPPGRDGRAGPPGAQGMSGPPGDDGRDGMWVPPNPEERVDSPALDETVQRTTCTHGVPYRYNCINCAREAGDIK